MRVHVYMGDMGGCGFFRLGWPGQLLRKLGHNISIYRPGEQDEMEIVTAQTPQGRKVVSFKKPDCDVVVFQRPLKKTYLDVIPMLRDAGIKVVADLDDDFRNCLKTHTGYRACNPATSPTSNWDILAAAMNLCDRVTGSTPAIVERYANPNSTVLLRNCILGRHLIEAPRASTATSKGVAVGWAGQVPTHPGDLDATYGAVGLVQRPLGFTFKVVGKTVRVRNSLHLVREPTAVGWMPIERYHEALNHFDVGIAPLADNAFNDAKSWLKPLEYAARGIPFIVSPAPEYVELVNKGAGVVAGTRAEWATELTKLVKNADLRYEQAVAGWEVARTLTLEEHIGQWESAWLEW